jgi:DNA-binding beta-propeller fold protein YncE
MKLLLLALGLAGAPDLQSPPIFVRPPERVVIANRAGASISVIDTGTDTVVATVPLPAAALTPEPMYVAVTGTRLWVGDRANDRVVAFDKHTLRVTGTVAVGRGVFHMNCDPTQRTLWVVNDIDKTVSIVDTARLVVTGTTPVPADLTSLGGKPHDIVVGASSAFVSMIEVMGLQDFVVRIDTGHLGETGRVAVGKDPHLALSPKRNMLFVPAQNASTVYAFDRRLNARAKIAVPNAHGACFHPDGKVFYTTDFAGGGRGGLVTIDARSFAVLGTTDAPFAVPHNVAITRDGRKVYVTHSGATSDKVSVYSVPSANHPVPVHLIDVTVGRNPFGLAMSR